MMRVTTLRAKRMSTRCQYEQRSCAAELIDAKDCAICMVHFTSDESCGVTCFPFWHAKFQRHMAIPPHERWSSLISLDLPGPHEAASSYWYDWRLEKSPHLRCWFDALWQMVTSAR